MPVAQRPREGQAHSRAGRAAQAAERPGCWAGSVSAALSPLGCAMHTARSGLRNVAVQSHKRKSVTQAASPQARQSCVCGCVWGSAHCSPPSGTRSWNRLTFSCLGQPRPHQPRAVGALSPSPPSRTLKKAVTCFVKLRPFTWQRGTSLLPRKETPC